MAISKEAILKEIRRIAETNGGNPPGRLVLESEAGIKESAWRGVYWAKWSDAVKEAGFEPNKITAAYPKEQLFEILAGLTQEMGHIPTYSELRLRTRSQRGIPTVFSRLGSKPEITVQLLAFCQTRQKFPDVVTICERVLASLPKDATENRDAANGDGFVYLIKSGKHYKIGRTNDPDRRGRELYNQTVEKNVRVHSIQTDDPSGIEAYWHRRFADKRVRADGEWFALSAKDVSAFKRRKKFM